MVLVGTWTSLAGGGWRRPGLPWYHPGAGAWGGGLCPRLAHDGTLPLGCVEFLSRPTMAFVRLREAVELDAVLEVPVPVRFLFLLLGPSSANMDYHEIGRSISTLMSDKVRPSLAPTETPPPVPPPPQSRSGTPALAPHPHRPWACFGSNSTRQPTWPMSGRTC